MLKHLLTFTLLSACAFLSAQVSNPGMVNAFDSLQEGKITVGACVDAYYTYDFSMDAPGDRPYFVSSSRHNEMNINLAYADFKYINKQIRAHFMPGFGTYMQANYSREPSALAYFVEANAGVRLSRKRDIWLDAGVLPSPYTNESPLSKDHLMYTRSLAAEYVPYYLSGIKLSVPLSARFNAYLYLLNGWQQIRDDNASKSFGSQVEYRPGKKWLINWDTYIGNEKSALNPEFRTRYFTDAYVVYNPKGKFSLTTCVYGGLQQKADTTGKRGSAGWWQANCIGSWKLSNTVRLSARAEYFEDMASTVVSSIYPGTGFSTFSAGLGINISVGNNALIRLEDRQFISRSKVYRNQQGNPSGTANAVAAGLCVWF